MNVEEKLEKTIQKVQFFGKIRSVFMFLAAGALAVYWLVGSVFKTMSWCVPVQNVTINIAYVLIVIFVIATFIKFFYFNKYKVLNQRARKK